MKKLGGTEDLAIISTAEHSLTEPCLMMLKKAKCQYYIQIREEYSTLEEKFFPTVVIKGTDLGNGIESLRNLFNYLYDFNEDDNDVVTAYIRCRSQIYRNE